MVICLVQIWVGLLFPEPPEPSDRVPLERGTTGISEESGTESWKFARNGAPKALRKRLVGEASASRLKVNMITASLGKAPEATLQTQTGSPQCDPEKVTWRPQQDFRVPVGAEGDGPVGEEVRPQALVHIGWAEGEELTPKREVAPSRGCPKAILEDLPARLEARLEDKAERARGKRGESCSR